MSDLKTTVEEDPLKDKKYEYKSKSLFEKLICIKDNVTVEPIFAGLVIGSMLSRIAIQNLNLDKACRVKQDLGDLICNALIEKNNYAYSIYWYKEQTQKIISKIEAKTSIIQTSIPTLLVMFMGAWSDRTGNRKICILLPVMGECLVCVSNIMSTYFFYEFSLELTMLLETLLPAITGGWVMMYLGVFSYISDITDTKTRTFRFGLANLCMTAGIPIGTALSEILLKFGGYYGVFLTSGFIYFSSFVYGCKYLKSNTKPGNDKNKKTEPLTMRDLITMQKETVQVVTKKREGNFRLKIILTLLVVALAYGPNHGEHMVLYLFVRYQLNWDFVKFSIYSTESIIIDSLGALFSISVLSKRWGWDDSFLCFISIFSKLVGSIYITFIYTDFQMFMVPVVEILYATTFISLRSMASKLVPSEEIGKMNSLFSLVETLAALMFGPTYTALYAYTMDKFTGAVFVYSAITTIPAISILIWCFNQHRRELKEKRAEARIDKLDVICDPALEKTAATTISPKSVTYNLN